MIDRATALQWSIAGLLVVVVFAGMVASIDKQEVQRTVDMAQAYCYQVHGSAEIYNAMVVGGHGGLHCIANTDVNGGDSAHLHQVPWEYVELAYEANQSGRQITFDHDEIAEPCKFLWCNNTDIGPLFLYILASVAVLGVILRFRSSGGDADE